jgi:hypothetical protein
MKTHDIRIKVSEDEYNTIRSKANDLGMTISAFLRFLALKSKVEIEVND